MARDEKGGVLTKKMIAVMAVMLFTVTAFALMLPAADAAESDGTFADIRAEKYVFGTNQTEKYTIYADGGDGIIRYSAKLVNSSGQSVGSVTTSTGIVDLTGTELSVMAPADPGTYELEVEFTFTDNHGDTWTMTKRAPVTVVNPITLTAVINNSGGTIVGMEVWFWVDGYGEIEDSKQTISIAAGGSQTVTYQWYTTSISGGEHTMKLMGSVGPLAKDVSGLDTPIKFYVGQPSYTLVEAIVVILFIVLIVVLIWVYRKPVKNVGKPKARRG